MRRLQKRIADEVRGQGNKLSLNVSDCKAPVTANEGQRNVGARLALTEFDFDQVAKLGRSLAVNG
jgi:hypothetical protein